MPSKSPREIVAAVDLGGRDKVELDTGRLLVSGFLAGAYIALGGTLAVVVGGGVPGLAAANPGLQKLVFGAVFPVGLLFVVLAGAELFTGNTATCIPAALSGRVSWRGLGRNWVLSYLGNFGGSLFVAFFLVFAAGLFSHDPWLSSIMGIAEGKVSQGFIPLLLKGVGCNWLVCLAVWLAVSAEDVAGKIAGIWFPIMAFVAIGFEHSVANMFFIPAGMLYGASVSWMQFLVGNLLPVTIGNIIGGAVFVGTVYWYLYGGGAADSRRRG